MKSPTKTIWKTVVFSAAILGGSVSLGCGSKDKHEAMDPCKDMKMHEEGGDPYGGDPYAGEGAWGDDGSGYGDPDDGRPRGGDDEGGDVGRGFVLN